LDAVHPIKPTQHGLRRQATSGSLASSAIRPTKRRAYSVVPGVNQDDSIRRTSTPTLLPARTIGSV
jgi:hypothetical protein